MTMRLFELITEATEDSRLIHSFSEQVIDGLEYRLRAMPEFHSDGDKIEQLVPAGIKNTNMGTLKKLVPSHPIYDVYPDLKNIKMTFITGWRSQDSVGDDGVYDSDKKRIELDTHARIFDVRDLLSVLIHELRHAVDDIQNILHMGHDKQPTKKHADYSKYSDLANKSDYYSSRIEIDARIEQAKYDIKSRMPHVGGRNTISNIIKSAMQANHLDGTMKNKHSKHVAAHLYKWAANLNNDDKTTRPNPTV